MPHLDEARIVEHLDEPHGDGSREVAAHLAACDTCRALADGLRAERDNAAAILARSGPDALDPPPFAEVLERAGRPGRRPGGGALRVLALAATAVFVVGVGWLSRDFVFRPDAPGVAARAPEPGAQPLGGLGDARADAPTPATVPAEQEAPTLARRSETEETRSDRDGAAAGGAGAREAVANRPAVPTPAPARSADLIAAAADSAAAVPERVTVRGQAAAAAAPAAPAREPQPAMASAAGRDAREDEAAAEAVAQRRLREVAARWQPIDRDAAARRLEGPLRLVPGLAVLDHAVDQASPDEPRVRTRQDLGGGTILELVQSRGPAPELFRVEVDATARDTLSQAVLRGGFTIVARAPVSADSLAALLARLRP